MAREPKIIQKGEAPKSVKYVVTSKEVASVFGIFDEYEVAQRACGAWTEDYGIAFFIKEEPFYHVDPPESWVEHVLRRLRGKR